MTISEDLCKLCKIEPKRVCSKQCTYYDFVYSDFRECTNKHYKNKLNKGLCKHKKVIYVDFTDYENFVKLIELPINTDSETVTLTYCMNTVWKTRNDFLEILLNFLHSYGNISTDNVDLFYDEKYSLIQQIKQVIRNTEWK